VCNRAEYKKVKVVPVLEAPCFEVTLEMRVEAAHIINLCVV
jgi:hypothetical protein